MPKYFFHVREDDIRFEDPQGTELPDLNSAWQHALSDAQTIAKSGQLKPSLADKWMEIADASGNVVATVPFTWAGVTH